MYILCTCTQDQVEIKLFVVCRKILFLLRRVEDSLEIQLNKKIKSNMTKF